MKSSDSFRMLQRFLAPVALALCCVAAPARETVFTGEGAMTFGRIQRADTSVQEYDGNFVRTTTAHLAIEAKLSEALRVRAGMGVIERHFLDAGIGVNDRNPMLFNPYFVEASFTWSFLRESSFKPSLTGGYFPYNYNPDSRNLGLYLLRGPVYPGILVSGFETRDMLGLGNTLGARLNFVTGPIEHDFILASETELYPLFDLSPAYIATFRHGRLLRVGAGVNFHHYIPIDSRLTNPDTLDYLGTDDDPFGNGAYSRTRIYVDTATGDTTYMSFRGIKLMANAAFDVKELFGGLPVFGPEDLKLYGEVALLGLDRRKAYRELYGDYGHRMPVMVGFNVPAFNLLDRLALEVEWYGSRVKDDLKRFQATTASTPSPIPVNPRDNFGNLVVDTRRDNLKWSLHASKTLEKHVRLSAQVANDHSRPGGTLTSPPAEWQALFTRPQDWYWMTKVAFFF
jgi:hypothetical protein